MTAYFKTSQIETDCYYEPRRLFIAIIFLLGITGSNGDEKSYADCKSQSRSAPRRGHQTFHSLACSLFNHLTYQHSPLSHFPDTAIWHFQAKHIFFCLLFISVHQNILFYIKKIRMRWDGMPETSHFSW